jgi:hypothetical protein
MTREIYHAPDIRTISQKGHQRFEELEPELDKTHHGWFVAIEAYSGDYFLGKTMIEADQKAQEKYPDKVFYVGRIGYPAAVSFRGYAPLNKG